MAPYKNLCIHAKCVPIILNRVCQAPLSMAFSCKNTEMGCHSLLQGILPIQGSNPHFLHLLHWQVNTLPLSLLGSPNVC